MARVFADYAAGYVRFGLTVVPAGGDDGKKPLIKGYQYARPSWLRWMVKKFPDANIGILDNCVTVIDVDDPEELEPAFSRYGKPKIITQTPGGGFHLWYSATGERRQISVDGRKLDVCGIGGIHIAPPSVRPDGVQYRFIRGGIEDLASLTAIQCAPDEIEHPSSDAQSGTLLGVSPSSEPPGLRWGEKGRRNRDLFDSARRIAPDCETINDLAERLLEVTSNMQTPLPAEDVNQVASSVWRYKQGDRLLLPGTEATVILTRSETEATDGTLSFGALGLLVKLKLEHGWRRGRPFVLGAAAAQSFRMSWNTLKRLRDELVRAGRLRIVSPGGRGPHDPPLVALI